MTAILAAKPPVLPKDRIRASTPQTNAAVGRNPAKGIYGPVNRGLLYQISPQRKLLNFFDSSD